MMCTLEQRPSHLFASLVQDLKSNKCAKSDCAMFHRYQHRACVVCAYLAAGKQGLFAPPSVLFKDWLEKNAYPLSYRIKDSRLCL